MLDKHVPLKVYLDAQARYVEADAAFDRAGAMFEELAERIGDDDRAYEMAGMPLADHRMFAAAKAAREAGERLARYARALPTVQKIMVIGAAMCAELPEAAND
jgi:hypothetical protein